MFPLSDWLDRDDVTDEDMVMLTAEDEVFDWLNDTPVPEQRRPEWLPEHAWQPRRQTRTVTRDRRSVGIAWGWIAGSLVLGAILMLSVMASAVGVAFVALA